mgnify:FL=1
MNEIITSTKNPKIKRLMLLQQKSAERRKEGVFIVEGCQEVMHCIHNGMQLITLYYCKSLWNEDHTPILPHATLCMEVTEKVYEKMAYRGSTEGLIAEVRTRVLTLSDISLSKTPLIIVLEKVEKPGNLGAVLRSADAAHADAVIVCDPLTDIFNPNIIRSSVGAIFTVPCVACTSEECISFLKNNHIQILTAQLQDSRLYYDIDMRRSTAIIMGTEATGLTQRWREVADDHIRIPMLGQIDSLNVSVSSAILLFEAVRQRQSDK